MTDDDLKGIEKAAKAANPGPWFTKETPKDCSGFPTCQAVAAVTRGQMIYAQPTGGVFVAANQEYIAMADPSTVAAMARELLVLRRAIKKRFVPIVAARMFDQATAELEAEDNGQ